MYVQRRDKHKEINLLTIKERVIKWYVFQLNVKLQIKKVWLFGEWFIVKNTVLDQSFKTHLDIDLHTMKPAIIYINGLQLSTQ